MGGRYHIVLRTQDEVASALQWQVMAAAHGFSTQMSLC